MRISDWSSDVCSSDLVVDVRVAVAEIVPEGEIDRVEGAVGHAVGAPGGADVPAPAAIGIATHPHEEALVPRLAVLHRLEAVPVREDVLHQVVLRLRRIGAITVERHGLRHEHAVMRGTVEAHVRREIVSPVEERVVAVGVRNRSEEHKSELQSLMRISYAVFSLKKKK